MYSGYGIAFDKEGRWIFGNCYAENVIIFGVNNSSSSHANNRKNNLLVLDEADTLVLMKTLVHQRKRLILTLLKQRQSFA